MSDTLTDRNKEPIMTWTKHSGETVPVKNGTQLEVKYRSGTISQIEVGFQHWKRFYHEWDSFDIIAYRPLEGTSIAENIHQAVQSYYTELKKTPDDLALHLAQNDIGGLTRIPQGYTHTGIDKSQDGTLIILHYSDGSALMVNALNNTLRSFGPSTIKS